MTNDRAIQLLHRLQDEQFDGIHGDERREALEMAVKALESNLVKESGDLVKDLVEDTISRQQAIDAMASWDWQELYLPIHFKQVLEELPSAYPEIIRCKDCKWFGEAGCAIRIVDDSDKPKEEDFCSFAER